MTDKTENGSSSRNDTDDEQNDAVERSGRSDRAERKSLDSLSSALRNNYQSTVDEGVPDIFQDLIQKLK